MLRVLCQTVLLVTVLLPTIAVTQQASPAPTPTATDDCSAWVDRCTGEHHCTSNSNTPTPPPSCHPLIPADLTPAPGVCRLNNGSCQFVDPCATWKEECTGTDYQCTTKELYQYHNCSSAIYQYSPPPPPKEKCFAINGTCQQYNPCRKWAGFCNGPYQCLTDVEYYKRTHGPQPACPVPQNTSQQAPIPPGECIYQNGQCVWSNCTAWFDVCSPSSVWSCTTHYVLESHWSLAPAPCPPPPYPGPASYLPQPGPCNYNVTAQRCNYIVNVTHPCESAMCPSTSTCEIYAPTNTAYCQVQCSINNGGCGDKLKCTLVNATSCYKQPCPLIVHCIDPCAGLNCSVDSQCMVDQPSGTGYCAPSCDLDNGGCAADQQCVLKQVQCITAPCPPIIQCVQACNQWMDRCTGQHHCVAGSNSTTAQPPSCYPQLPPDFTPAPGVCTFVNGSCQFVNLCITWNNDCNYGADYQCIARKNHQPQNCSYYQQPPPPPKDECFPINGTCQQYNPCRKWAGFCNGPYQCLTDVEYYKRTHGPQPTCASNSPEPPLPPGECIYQRGQCVWSNCTSSLDQCGQFWECQSHYDYQNDKSRPPHPCPFPGPGFTPPPQPGPCHYNLTTQMCQYFANTVEPCSTAICPTGRVCQIYSPTNTTYCQPHCDIDNGGCQTAELCSLVNQTCFPGRPCPPKVVCKPDPCAAIRCQNGYQCKVDASTGNGYCDPSCDINNGGCPADAKCALIPVQCITTPCPPTVHCVKDTCPNCTGKCVTRNSTDPLQCLPSCFVSNGGCQPDQICTTIPASECSTRRLLYCTSVPTSLQCSNTNDFNGKCVPGMTFSTCASACELTCDTYLTNTGPIICPAVCVQECVCPTGLVRFRDRCVSPLECVSLLNNPPPIDPLPQPSDTLLIGFNLTNTTVAQFKNTIHSFGSKLRQLLSNNGIDYPSVKLYAVIQNRNSKRNSDTSTQIFVVMAIRSSRIEQGMTGDEMVDIIQKNIATLDDVQVTALSTVYAGNNGGVSVLSPAVIGGIVSGVVVFIALIVLVTVILVLVGRAYYKRRPKQSSLTEFGSYSKLKGVLSNIEPD